MLNSHTKLVFSLQEFDSLKQILCLSFQRNFCILQTSVKQIACLSWKSDQNTDIIWALEVGEFAVWSFCDKLFVNYEPHTKSLRKYNLIVFLNTLTTCNITSFLQIYTHCLKARLNKLCSWNFQTVCP